MNLQILDEATTDVATRLHAVLLSYGASKVRFCYRVTPDGGVTAPDFWFTQADGSEKKDLLSKPERRAVSDSADTHWRLAQALGQPRWYMMTVNLSRNGTYSTDFDYRDTCEEGDIMKSLE